MYETERRRFVVGWFLLGFGTRVLLDLLGRVIR